METNHFTLHPGDPAGVWLNEDGSLRDNGSISIAVEGLERPGFILLEPAPDSTCWAVETHGFKPYTVAELNANGYQGGYRKYVNEAEICEKCGTVTPAPTWAAGLDADGDVRSFLEAFNRQRDAKAYDLVPSETLRQRAQHE